MTTETPLSFDCRGAPLVGIVHRGRVPGKRGVLIVVGGPQYRAGSHRQFLLLARALADAGIPAMRFDQRGIGDSGGEFPGFEALDDDIRSAIDAFAAAVPEIEEVVLWGLCDAASAILFYAHRDPRVAGAVLLNPWVRSESGYAKTQLKHYYLRRLASRDLWRKILGGRFELAGSLASFLGIVRKAKSETSGGANGAGNPLAERMAEGFRRFARPVLLIVSGNDLTAREFDDAAKSSPGWRDAVRSGRLARCDLPGADHTFSRRTWRDQVAAWTRDWVEGL
ncbi:MAG: hydrolase 1, exosortase A system-associated [Rhodospirillaceae bacterium]